MNLLTFDLKNYLQITCKHKINIENNLLPACVRVINLDDGNQYSISLHHQPYLEARYPGRHLAKEHSVSVKLEWREFEFSGIL